MADLSIRIGTDLRALRTGLQNAEKRLARFGRVAENVGRDLTTRVSLPILGIGAAAVQTFATFDRLEKGLAAVSGSAAEGKRQFDGLIDVVKDAQTTLDLKGAVTASLQLQAAGRSAEDTLNILRQLGIAATASGAAAEDVGEVGRQLAQAASKGRLLQQELRIVLERIPAISQVMKEEFGVITADAIREAGVSADEFITRLTNAIEKNERLQSIQISLAKAIETFGIEVQIAGKKLGEAIAEAINLQELLLKISGALAAAADAFANLSPQTQRFIVLASGAAAAVGPLTFGLGVLARITPLLSRGFGLARDAFSGFAFVLQGSFQILRRVSSLLLLEMPKAFGQFVKDLVVSTRQVGFKTTAVTLLNTTLGRLRIALLTVLGPFLTVTAVVSALVAGFIAAYRNSEFFRFQLAQIRQEFIPLTQAFNRLAREIFPNLNISISGIGDVFRGVLSILAGGVAFIVQAFLEIIRTIKLVSSALVDIGNLQFGSALEKLGDSLFNPGEFAAAAERAIDAAVTVFDQSLDGRINNTAFGSTLVPEIEIPEDDDGPAKDKGGRFGINDGLFERLGNLQLEVDRLDTAFSNVGAEGPKALNEQLFSTGDSLRLINEFMGDYRKQLDQTVEKQLILGDSYDGISDRLGIVRSKIIELTESEQLQNVAGRAEAIKALTAEYKAYQEELQRAQLIEERDQELLNAKQSLFESIGINFELMRDRILGASEGIATAGALIATTLTASFDEVAKGELKLGQAIAKASREIIGSFIREGVAAVVRGELIQKSGLLGVLAIPLAALAGSAANALFQTALTGLKVPFLADGGITVGPGLFVAGEAGPEAIIPLDRLNEFMNNGSSELYGEIRADGSELLVVMQAAQARQNRSYGN